MPTLVVAALSARWLAQSARRAGYDVVALDLFGDVDTCAAATTWRAIGASSALRIDGARFLAALEDVRRTHECIGWIAGAGFEPCPDLLEAGARVLPLLGNARAVVEDVRDPRRFFGVLDGLGIAHPATAFESPPDPGGWLEKDFASSGGWHVRALAAHGADSTPPAYTAPTPSVYFQRPIEGRPMSALFLAAQTQARVVAFNELLVRPHGARPYVYHGAIGPITGLPPAIVQGATRAAERLTRAFNLRGFASLDFIAQGERFAVLELNARPSSTMALYDAQTAGGLVTLHLDACAGTLPDGVPIDGNMQRGELTVFARTRVSITQPHVAQLLALDCRDVPQEGSNIAASAPLCTVAAVGPNLETVRTMLAEREAMVRTLVQNRNEAHDHAG